MSYRTEGHVTLVERPRGRHLVSDLPGRSRQQAARPGARHVL